MSDIETEQKIKVALVGTIRTGKTTVTNTLKTQLGSDVRIVRESARDFHKKHPDIPDRFSLSNQVAIQQMTMRRELRAQKSKAKYIICDRSVIDAAAYSFIFDTPEIGLTLLNGVSHHIGTYQRIYLLDPEGIPHQQDAIRTEDAATRQRIHEGFVEFFTQQSIAHVLLSGTKDQRIQTVLEFLYSA